MGFLSVITESSAIMCLVAFVFAVFGVRCLLYGIMGGTSFLLRITGAIIFIAIAYYFWQYSGSLHSKNIIDQFVYESWDMIKGFFAAIF